MATPYVKRQEHYGFGSHGVNVVKNHHMTLQDGVQIAMKFFFPREDLSGTDFEESDTYLALSEEKPCDFKDRYPIILEYLPYRKSDSTADRDHRRHIWFASHGYVSARVDMRGTGDSDGFYYGEYLEQEQTDCLEIISWLAKQSWSNGSVGMYGKSWGGFNGLQMAYLQPPELKAVISLYSTDNRFTTDCHFQDGCVIGHEMLEWAAQMFLWNSQPPHPEFISYEDFERLWKIRLSTTTKSKCWVRDWLMHQSYDGFWKHGSICENYSRVTCPVLAIGGWVDPYTDAVFRMVEKLPLVRGLIGPWSHEWPDTCSPGPNIDFLGLCLRWWDYHLKGLDNGVMDMPKFRVYLLDGVPPSPFVSYWPGNWYDLEQWPCDTSPYKFYLNLDSMKLEATASPKATDRIPVSGNLSCGLWYGEWLSHGTVPDLAGDQQLSDALFTSFESQCLSSDIVLLGFPKLTVTFSVKNSPTAMLAVKLCDVFPDGQSFRVSFQTTNLNQAVAEVNSEISPLTCKKLYNIDITLQSVGYIFRKGHRIRLCLSSCMWPSAWPSPFRTTIMLHRTENTPLLILPCAPTDVPVTSHSDTKVILGTPKLGPPLKSICLEAPSFERYIHYSVSDSLRRVIINSNDGKFHFPEHDTTMHESSTQIYEIRDRDPLTGENDTAQDTQSAEAVCKKRCTMDWPNILGIKEGGPAVEITTNNKMTCTQWYFFVTNKINVRHFGKPFFEDEWVERIKRHFV